LALGWLADKFTRDRRYAHQQVDEVLDRWCSWQDSHRLDIVTVTRALADQQRLARTRDERWYWRADSPLAQDRNSFVPEQLPQAETSTAHQTLSHQTRPRSPLRDLVKVAMRIKANQPYSVVEIDG